MLFRSTDSGKTLQAARENDYVEFFIALSPDCKSWFKITSVIIIITIITNFYSRLPRNIPERMYIQWPRRYQCPWCQEDHICSRRVSPRAISSDSHNNLFQQFLASHDLQFQFLLRNFVSVPANWTRVINFDTLIPFLLSLSAGLPKSNSTQWYCH